MPRKPKVDETPEQTPKPGGIATDEGGRPLTDEGGRPIRKDEQ